MIRLPEAVRRRAALLAVAALGLVGCDSTLQLNLIIYDPCNQKSLDAAQHMEVRIGSDPNAAGEGAVWEAGTGQGEAEVPVLPDAIISVIGRKSDGNGRPSDAVVAATVGRVDLTGADGNDLVELTVAAGKVGYFMNTTSSANPAECSKLAASRREHTATLLDDGRVLILGGTGLQSGTTMFWETTEIYRPTQGEFVTGPKLTWTRRGHSATALGGGRVLIVGGIALMNQQEQALLVGQIFDAASDTFTDMVEFAQQRAFHTATLLDDGTVLVVGGQMGQIELQSSEIYDPLTKSARPGPSLQTPRSHHAAVRVGPTTVAVIGGRGSGGVLSSIEFLSTSPMETIPGPTLTTGRSHAVAAVIPDKDAVLIAGGFGTAVTLVETAAGLDSMEILRLNPQNLRNSSVVCSTLRLTTARGAAAIAPVPGGLLIAGGVGAVNTVQSSAEVIVATNLDACLVTATATSGSMAAGRGGLVLTPMLGGDLLVTGGFGIAAGAQPQVSTLGPAEIYIRPRD